MLNTAIHQKISELQQANRKRTITDVVPLEHGYVTLNGKKYLSFCSNDYLGLAHHASVKQAAINAIDLYGVGAVASRLITGNHPLYQELEQTLATMKHTERCVVFGSGYLANIGVITALMGKGDVIIADKLSHACLLDGATLSGATLKRFKHNNLADCQRQLERYRSQFKHCMVITETVFSMDGDIAPIASLKQIVERYDAVLLSDDAHGLGLPIVHEAQAHIQTGTLSKSAASYGGYVCVDNIFAEYITTAARSLIYSTALPPATIASATVALKIMQSQPQLGEKALDNAQYFTDKMGIEKAVSPIVPLMVGDDAKALALSDYLKEHGFLVWAIRPPTVPPNTARLRIAFSALHKHEDIDTLADLISQWKLKHHHE